MVELDDLREAPLGSDRGRAWRVSRGDEQVLGVLALPELVAVHDAVNYYRRR